MKVAEMQKLLKRNSLKGRLELEVVGASIESLYVDNADLAGNRIAALREKYINPVVVDGKAVALSASQQAYNLSITQDIEFWTGLRERVSKPRERI